MPVKRPGAAFMNLSESGTGKLMPYSIVAGGMNGNKYSTPMLARAGTV
jgi:hypothetical protein